MKNFIINVFNKFNINYFFIALFHWYISFFTDKFIFNYNLISISNLFVYKGIFLILLILLWHFIFYCIHEYKINNDFKIFIKSSFIYFSIMMFFLLLCWPGIWRCDEFAILRQAFTFESTLWQGFMISKFYIFFLMFLPFPSGIIIIQNAIISLIVGYIFIKVKQNLCNNKFAYLIFIPFFLFPIIDNNLYPMRTTLYAYFILLLSIKILFLDYKNIISFKDIFILLLLVLLISLIRLEGLIFLLFVPILLFISFRKKINSKCYLFFFITTILFIFVFFYIKNNVLSMESGTKYEVYSMLAPMSNLYSKADDNLKKELLPQIEKFIDYDKFIKGSQCNIHDDKIFNNFSDTNYKNFKKIYLKLIINNPKEFFLERYNLFCISKYNIWNTTALFDENKKEDYEQHKNIIQCSYFAPINSEIRKKFISFIERRDVSDYYKCIFGFDTLYSVVIPTIILLFLFIVSIIMKKYTYSILLTIFIIHTMVVFLTAPVAIFIYYFYLYLCIYVFFIIFLNLLGTKNEI